TVYNDSKGARLLSEEIRPQPTQIPQAGAKTGGVDWSQMWNAAPQYEVAGKQNAEQNTSKPKQPTISELLELDDDELIKRGLDRNSLLPVQPTQGNLDIEKRRFDSESESAGYKEHLRREAVANKILKDTNVLMPGDVAGAGDSDNKRTDESISITSEQRVQNAFASPKFIGEDWKDIKPSKNTLALPCALLAHGFAGNGEKLPIELEKGLSREVVANKAFRDRTERLIQQNVGKDFFESDDDPRVDFADDSVRLSLGKASIKIRGTKLKGDSWLVEFSGKDAYDYSRWIDGISLTSIANNWAYTQQGMGMIKPYPVYISGAFVYEPE
ncbi:MAG: hypothetical protein RR632_07700, partial [Christensenella sp.]